MAEIRAYDPRKDREAVQRILKEVGWARTDEADREGWDAEFQSARITVAEMGGAAETVTAASAGTIRYLSEDISLSLIGLVATSREARRQGLATRTTARSLSDAVKKDGAAVAILGLGIRYPMLFSATSAVIPILPFAARG